MGEAMDLVCYNVDWRTLLYLLHLCSNWWIFKIIFNNNLMKYFRCWSLVDCEPGHGWQVQHCSLIRSHLRVRWRTDAHSCEVSGTYSMMVIIQDINLHLWVGHGNLIICCGNRSARVPLHQQLGELTINILLSQCKQKKLSEMCGWQ